MQSMRCMKIKSDPLLYVKHDDEAKWKCNKKNLGGAK